MVPVAQETIVKISAKLKIINKIDFFITLFFDKDLGLESFV